MIEYRVFPRGCIVAAVAAGAERPVMFVVFLVACGALGRCSRVTLDVATLTFYLNMFAIQCEIRATVVKICRLPGLGGVADGAIRAKLSIMLIILLMAVGASAIRYLERL